MKNPPKIRIVGVESSNSDVTKGDYLLLADRWVKIRVNKTWGVPSLPVAIPLLAEDDIAWLISVVRHPRILLLEEVCFAKKAGRLELLLQRHKDEVITLMFWARETILKQYRTKGAEVKASRLTDLAGKKEIEGNIEFGPGGMSAVKNADKAIRLSVQRAAKNTDTKH